MAIHIESAGIHDLASDCRQVGVGAYRTAARAVGDIADEGNRWAKESARQTAGRHGKHYHKAFTSERVGPAAYEYGPVAAMPQGGMSFEFGSRNQPPHLDLTKSADLIGPKLADKVGDAIDRSFWNG